jgi:hypothetical protein
VSPEFRAAHAEVPWKEMAGCVTASSMGTLACHSRSSGTSWRTTSRRFAAG